jgi:nucleoside-diphosphate-sugar epimerase
MKSALIIGCGYIGGAVAQSWTTRHINVTATTTRPERLQNLQAIAKDAYVLNGDDPQTMERLLAGKECVVMSVAAKGAQDYANTYLTTAKNLVTALKDHPEVTQVVYTSSTSVYGDCKGEWVDETRPLAPTTPQAKILAEAEQILLSAATDTRHICVLRLGEIIGPERSIEQRLATSRLQPLPGDGSNFTNIIHQSDIVRAIDFAVSHRLTGVYNLCNDLHITRKELYQQICDRNEWPPVTWDPSRPSLHGGNKRINCDKIKATGFSL